MPTTKERFLEKVDKTGECWLWTGNLDKHNTPQFKLLRNGKRTTTSGQKYAWELVFGPVPEGFRVSRCTKNRLCVRPAHLALKTRTAIAQAAGKMTGKLTDAQLTEIRVLEASGHSRKEIAARFGRHPTSIGRMLRQRSYTHLHSQLPLSGKVSAAWRRIRGLWAELVKLFKRH